MTDSVWTKENLSGFDYHPSFLDPSRRTGKTFRACLEALLLASQGRTVALVTGNTYEQRCDEEMMLSLSFVLMGEVRWFPCIKILEFVSGGKIVFHTLCGLTRSPQKLSGISNLFFVTDFNRPDDDAMWVKIKDNMIV